MTEHTVYTRTENNALTHILKNACLSLFSKIGAMRSTDPAIKIEMFNEAAKESPELATQILFWCRDARQGNGERKTFNDILSTLNPEFVANNFNQIANLGYAKDLFNYFDNPRIVANYGDVLLGTANGAHQELFAKWAPRRGSNYKKLKNYIATVSSIKTNKEFRKLLVEGSLSFVEQLITIAKRTGDWSIINYSTVCGAAMRKHSGTFTKYDRERFEAWKADKESKAAVSASYPHDITRVIYKDGSLAQKLWDSLPDFTGSERPLVIADTSGSMRGLPMEVSVSLGIYCAEKMPGHFQNKLITFSENPNWHDLSPYSSIKEKWDYLWKNSNWGMSTNFEKAYSLVLTAANTFNVPQENMPTMIVVLSDMQFDKALNGHSRWTNKGLTPPSHHEIMKAKFEASGYKFPKLVYWNLRKSFGSPATDLSENTALIPGFNPAILRPLLSGGDFTPTSIMMNSVKHIELDFSAPPLILCP
jgi:hypothetical protein